MIEGKKIILGVTGSIAAYKIALLTRLLVKKGAEVKIIMTSAAKNFITPLTLSTLSKNPVIEDMWDESDGTWSNHVALGLWADVMVIAPTSANTLGKLAHGISDNMLISTYLSAKCPVMIAPAMDRDMYTHPSTVQNLSLLKNYGNMIIEPTSGELASGLMGKGRMAEPEDILSKIEDFFSTERPLTGKKILITSGPTYEALDPVRFIGNHSSGKMGVALAEACASLGADVTMVSGPSKAIPSSVSINVINVNSADEMYHQALEHYPNADIAIFAAAVADYKPKTKNSQKIKKADNTLSLELVKNKDIAFELGRIKKIGQINIGFALETEHEEVNAKKKLEKKNFDLIVLNSLNDPGAGFSKDTNKVTIFTKNREQHDIGLKDKAAVAKEIIDYVISNLL